MNPEVETGVKLYYPISAEVEGKEQLSALLLSEGYPGAITGKDLDKIAARLSEFAPPDHPVQWKRKYLDNVLHNRQDASPALIDAIRRMMAAKNGTPDLLVRARPAQGALTVGSFTPGAVILADSRPCANPACPVHFVPRVPWQRYCNPKCR